MGNELSSLLASINFETIAYQMDIMGCTPSGKVIGIFQRWSCDLLSSTKLGLTSLKTSSGERLEESSIFSMRELLKYSSMFRPR